MDTTINYVSLSGSKESVTEADNEYNREQVRQTKQAPLAIIARETVWAYQTIENKWRKYSRQLNARIEDAHLSRLARVSFIVFTYLIERCSSIAV